MNSNNRDRNVGMITPASFKRHKIIKISQLIIEGVIAILYIITLLFNDTVQEMIMTNRSILYMTFYMWILLLISFLGSFYDFYSLQASMHSSHMLGELAYLDATTGIPNRNSCDEFIRLFKTPESIRNAGCAVFTITNLSSINNSFGHTSGNNALKSLSTLLEEAASSYGFVGRNGSNDFLAILDDCNEEKMNEFIKCFEDLLDLYNASTPEIDLCVEKAYVLNKELKKKDVYEMIRTAYQQLHLL